MEFEPVIGLEIHARISTQTKMFCRCSNNVFNAEPNTHVCPICMGFPGMLPLTNKEAVRKGIIAGLALGCTIPEYSKFDRKSYFYPDLPKGFQISQYDKPVAINGKITITAGGETKVIRINRLHLEDDAGKLTHTEGGTLVDLNRSGCPLMEIVSEADLSNTEEASAYARQIQKIVRYVGCSDADMEKGQMRFDLNISLRPKGQEKFGTKAEVKNLNSFKSLEKALEYEIKRQEKILNEGGTIIQETRGWDDDKEITVSQRTKEGAADYRYFPEPDIAPLLITNEQVEKLKKEMPQSIDEMVKDFVKQTGVNESEARQAVWDNIPVIIFVNEGLKSHKVDFQKLFHWVLNDLLGLLNKKGLSLMQSKLEPGNLAKFVKLIEDGTITGKIAKEIFAELYETNSDPEKLVEKKGLKVMADTGALEKIIQQVLEKNQKIVADFKGGKQQALGALVGQIMAATKGSANPKQVNEILRKILGA